MKKYAIALSIITLVAVAIVLTLTTLHVDVGVLGSSLKSVTPTKTSTPSAKNAPVQLAAPHVALSLILKTVPADDVNEDSTGYNAALSPMWFGNGSGVSYTGLRFVNVNIPRGATIDTAVLELMPSTTQWIQTSIAIYAEDTGNSVAFSTSNKPSQRKYTTQSVLYNQNVQWQANAYYSIGDIKAVVQAIVNRADWNSGNALDIILVGTGGNWGRKMIYSADASAINAPRLTINTSSGATPANTLVPPIIANTPTRTATNSLPTPTFTPGKVSPPTATFTLTSLPPINTETRTSTAVPATSTVTRTSTAVPATSTATRTNTLQLPTATLAPTVIPPPAAPSSSEWTQDAHDAQRTGYSPVEPAEPWTLLWTWNGADANGGTGNHLYNAPREARTVTGGNNIYVPAGANGLYALTKSNGAQVWRSTVAIFNGTPAYANGSLFAGGANGILYKFDANTGAVVGSFNTGSAINRAILIAGNNVYALADNGQLSKVDLSAMTRLWVYSANSTAGTGLTYSAGRDVIVFGTEDLYVHAVNNSIGTAKWRVKSSPNAPGTQSKFGYQYPVIAEQHGIVFVRQQLEWNACLWGYPSTGNKWPNTAAEARTFLINNPQYQSLFALNLDDGSKKFVPATGCNGTEENYGTLMLDIGQVPVVKVNSDGSEVAYTSFRNGQSGSSDGRSDSNMGEMVLDNTTFAGLVAGDLRFVKMSRDGKQGGNSDIFITDEQNALTLAGNTIFHAHWGASESIRITDRSAARGLTYVNPIQSSNHPTIIRRQANCLDKNTATHFTTCGLTLFNDGRYWDGPGFWSYWNLLDPPTPLSGGYSDGIRPRYTYVSGNLMIVEGNGGELMVFQFGGTGPVLPTSTPLPSTSTPTSTRVASATSVPTGTPVAVSTATPVVAATATPIASGSTSVTSFYALPSSAGRYQKYEASFQISRAFAADSLLPYYPFSDDANGITIDAVLMAPSGRVIRQPAFYYRDDARSGANITPGAYSWRVRFAPEELGRYNWQIEITDASGTSRSASKSFDSVASGSRGFARVDPNDSRFMRFDGGQQFIPLASGHQWWKCCGNRTQDYETAFNSFGANGINLTRVWTQNDAYGLTVENHFDAYAYPDDYNPADRGIDLNALPKGTQINARGARELDFIIEAAERNSVYLELSSHGDPFWTWAFDVYGQGTTQVSDDDPRHLAYWERNARYRIARWGYSTAILAWERWNEHGHVVPNTDVFRFYQQYNAWLRANDPYHHLITTSQGSQTYSPSFWSTAGFDIANYHDYLMISRYPANLTNDEANFVSKFSWCLGTNGQLCSGLGLGDGTSWSGANKPWIWGEIDVGTTIWNQVNPLTQSGDGRIRFLHNSTWAGLMSPLATSPIDWYWDQEDAATTAARLVDRKRAAQFMAGADYAGTTFLMTQVDAPTGYSGAYVTTSNAQARVYGMRSANLSAAYAWVQNRDYTWANSPNVPAAQNTTVTIPGLTGNYAVSVYDTWTGTTTNLGTIAASGSLTVNVSGLSKDVAIKAVKQ